MEWIFFDKQQYYNYVKDMIIYEAMQESFSCNWIVNKDEIQNTYKLNEDEFHYVYSLLETSDMLTFIEYDAIQNNIEFNIGTTYNIGYTDEHNQFGDYFKLKNDYFRNTFNESSDMKINYYGDTFPCYVSFEGKDVLNFYPIEYCYNEEHFKFHKEVFKANYFDKLYDENIIEHQEEQEENEDDLVL